MKHSIEIFTAGCAICEETIEAVKQLGGTQHEVHVYDMHKRENASRAKRLGLRSVPAVVVDGKLAKCTGGGVDEHVLREALR